MSVTGIPSVLIAISFFSGIILIKLGIISLYLKRIFDQTKNRPEYIIKRILKKIKMMIKLITFNYQIRLNIIKILK